MKGFTKDGKFHPIKSYKKIRKKRSLTKPDGLLFKTTTKREKSENETLKFQLKEKFEKGDIFSKTLDIDPKTFLKAVQDDPNWVPAFGEKSVKEIKKRLEEGKTLDKPFLLLIKGMNKDLIVGHQGRHRAFTAKELGIKTIPVEILCQQGKTDPVTGLKMANTVTAKCKGVDEKVLLNAISQFEKQRKENESDEDYKKDIEVAKKYLKKIKKIKNQRPEQEQDVFELGFRIRNMENNHKLAVEIIKKQNLNSEKIKDVFE